MYIKTTYFKLFIYLFGFPWSSLWHAGSLIFSAAWGIFSCGMQTLSCDLWDLVPRLRIESGLPGLGGTVLPGKSHN